MFHRFSQWMLHSHHAAAQFIRFGMVGSTGVVIGLVMLNLMLCIVPEFVTANVLSFVFVATWNFAFNRAFTFEACDKSILIQWSEFVAGCLAGAVLSWGVSGALYYGNAFFHAHHNLAAIAGIVVGSGANFAWAKMAVFVGAPRSETVGISA